MTWKVVKDPDLGSSVTIFMINNPHLTSFPENALCDDICSLIRWVDWDVKDIHKGVTFCCFTSDIRNSLLPFLPDAAV